MPIPSASGHPYPCLQLHPRGGGGVQDPVRLMVMYFQYHDWIYKQAFVFKITAILPLLVTLLSRLAIMSTEAPNLQIKALNVFFLFSKI